MIYIHFIVIALLLVSLLMGYRNQRWLYFLLAICMVVLFSFSVNIPDYSAYKYFYDHNGEIKLLFINGDSSSILFSCYALFFKKIGFNYDFFRLMTFCIVAVSLFHLLKNKIEIGIFITAYALVPFIFDLAQIRFFLSEVLCLIALCYLINNQRFFFFLLMIAATFIHSMNLLWIMIFFIPLDIQWEGKNEKKGYLAISLFFAMSLISTSLITVFQNIISNIAFFNEYQNKLLAQVKNGYIIYAIYQVANVFTAIYANKKSLILHNVPIWNKRLNSLNYSLQIIGILLIVLTKVNINFCRFFRMLFLLNMLNFASLIFLQSFNFRFFSMNKFHSNKISNIIVYMSLIGLWIVLETNALGAYSTIIKDVYKNFPSLF